MFFPALLAKFLSAGAFAQAATGAGVVLVVATGAGAAGVLPEPVQDTFSSVVGTETADETPATEDPAVPAEPTGTTTDVTGGDVTEYPAVSTETPDPSDAAGFELDPDQSFGQQINGRVEHGEIDGRKVSDWAHERNDQRRSGTTASPTPSTAPEADDSEDSDESDASETAEAESESESGSGGGGSGNGRGHN